MACLRKAGNQSPYFLKSPRLSITPLVSQFYMMGLVFSFPHLGNHSVGLDLLPWVGPSHLPTAIDIISNIPGSISQWAGES